MTPKEFQALPTEEQSARIKAAGRSNAQGLPEAVQSVIEEAELDRLDEAAVPPTSVTDCRTSKRSEVI